MASTFPGSADNITNNVTNSTPELDTHPNLHNKLADAVNAVETALLPGGSMNLAAHVAAADPHAVYLTQTEGDVRYAAIGGGGTIADGSITSAKIADGTIATVDLANGAVTNAKLAADTARANLLTNGGFEIWQRGNGPFTGATLNADRWQFNVAGASTYSISKDTVNMDGGSGACAAVTYTHSAASAYLTYLTEQLPQLIGRTLTLSIRTRTSTANAVRATCTVVGGTGSTTGTVHSGGGTYQTLTLTTTVGAGAAVIVWGLDFLLSCTAYVDNAMLVVGSVPAEYAPLHPADDLARCQRYYETREMGASGIATAGTQAVYTTGTFKQTKSVTPTITIGTSSSVNAGNVLVSTFTQESLRVAAVSTAAGAFYSFAPTIIEANP